MEEQVNIRVFKTSLIITFLIGFLAGYKAKEWRMRIIKFRRDRLAKKLSEAQKTLDLLAPSI
ncbi:hypothetical protein O3M35_003349 [Rhynocoris fuscipes]|uniref:Mitoregulin n=1 Tax=Rhynocoris fuscipes TaxID=488301 RepID=A0AAW1CQJ0_9HEMI